ncbi:zf-TFIIB domain-containing protein [Myceligenerans pegani]|uniref:Zf-TFIIB domain-containing protein n=1 Tax=Myceligenerans pegani TaxID=2776917 RepID=A0ABR9MVB4_9MICO|nr:zf-TFIIB domain-containing protein [Myceligenerans sp. TRM 65318]MBE1875326.1 zf-TFIIB domain-containing protein [Myceligenerans sp. TRM 65318]MBE3017597.1 zf-TFIIB domain-containing protein [Myceligenerans sp. TRM 65318]
MQCPTDQTTLVMADRKGVEIDYCPQCRGVWLDRGELDKIIDRSIDGEIAAENTRPPAAPQPQQPLYPAQPRYDERRYDDDRRYDDRRRDHYDPRYGKKKRKESFLGDLFDF